MSLERDRLTGLIAAYSLVVAITIALGLTLPLVPLAMARAGYGSEWIGLNGTVGAAALLVTAPFVPWAAERVGPIRFLYACLAITVAALALFPFTPIPVWYPLRFILNCALQGLFVASEIWINTLAPERYRGRLIGLYGALATGGFAAGPAVAAQFDPGSMWPFLAGAAVTALSVIPVFAARGQAPAITHLPMRGLARLMLAAPLPILAGFVHAIAETSATSFLPLYGVAKGWVENHALLLLSVFGLGNVLLQFLVSWLADTRDRMAVLAGCAVVAMLGGLLLPSVGQSPVPLLIIVFVWGGAIIGLYTVGLTLVGQMFKAEGLSAASAAFSFAYAVGSLCGPGGAGLAVGRLGPDGLGLYIAVFTGLYALIVVARALRRLPAP